MQELGCGNLFIIKASTIGKSLEKFYELFLLKSPVSFKNEIGRKTHSFINFYGYKENCERAFNNLQISMNKVNLPSLPTEISEVKLETPTIDLTVSPVSKKQKMKRDSRSDFSSNLEEKLNSIQISIHIILSKLESLQKTLDKKVDQSHSITMSGETVKPPDGYIKSNKLLEAELRAEFIKILVTKRASPEVSKTITVLIRLN